jgi:hypothetical protein
MVSTDQDAQLARIRALHSSWALIRLADGSYRAMRDWWGNQQIIRVTDPDEMETRPQALPPPTEKPQPA